MPLQYADDADSMLGETSALLALCAAMAIWLLIHRAWRTAIGIALAVAAEQSLVALMKDV